MTYNLLDGVLSITIRDEALLMFAALWVVSMLLRGWLAYEYRRNTKTRLGE